MSITGACKAIILPVVAITEMHNDKNSKKMEHNNKENFDMEDQEGGGKAKYYLSYAVQVVIFLIAGYLAWTCNAGESTLMRVLYTIIAAMFSGFYLLYYAIYYGLMGNRCGAGATTGL